MISLLSLAALLAGIASARPSSRPSANGSTPFQYFISFGDSYSQTGFNVSLSKPSASNPIGNPNFPGYTTDNGNNWIDNVVAKYNNSLIYSYNFASGGATTDASLVAPFANTVFSLVDQVSQFSSSLGKKPSYAPWTSENALFGIWIGVNDVGNAWGQSDWTTLAPEIVTRYFQEVQSLYDDGARNFVFLTVPPIQKTPLVLAESTAVQTQEGAAVVTYNNLITSQAASFKANNSGVTTYFYDTTVPFNDAINDPSSYGAANATCYDADGVTCLWWNNYHPGQAIQNLVGQGVAALVGI